MTKKLALIQLYNSQFRAVPRSIEQFTPVVALSNAPHEAIWTDEPAGPLLPDAASQFASGA